MAGDDGSEKRQRKSVYVGRHEQLVIRDMKICDETWENNKGTANLRETLTYGDIYIAIHPRRKRKIREELGKMKYCSHRVTAHTGLPLTPQLP